MLPETKQCAISKNALRSRICLKRIKSKLINVANAALAKWTEQLSVLYPQLSKLELKICFFTYKGHSNKEISTIQFALQRALNRQYRIKSDWRIMTIVLWNNFKKP